MADGICVPQEVRSWISKGLKNGDERLVVAVEPDGTTLFARYFQTLDEVYAFCIQNDVWLHLSLDDTEEVISRRVVEQMQLEEQYRNPATPLLNEIDDFGQFNERAEVLKKTVDQLWEYDRKAHKDSDPSIVAFAYRQLADIWETRAEQVNEISST